MSAASSFRGIAALLVCLALLVSPGRATAHAVLLDTSPADRAVAGEAPAAITLRFNEPVDPVFVRLIDSHGTAISGRMSEEDTVVKFMPAAPLSRGAFTVSWRVISADSHPIAGALQFAVGPPPPSWQAVPQQSATAKLWTSLAIANRALFLMGFVVAVGGALYGVVFGRKPRRAIAWAAPVAIVTAILAIGIEGGVALDAPLGAILDPETWRFGLSTTRGIASLVAIAGLAAILFRLEIVGALVALASFALTGHAVTAPPRVAALPGLLIHAVCATVWLGAFVGLARAERGEGRRFAPFARWGLPTLLIAGVVVAALQLRAVPPLFETGYGLILLAKITFATALIAVVYLGRKTIAAHTKTVLGILLALGGMVLVATAILTEIPPPRSLAASAAEARSVTAMHSAKFMATVEVSPGRAGRNAVAVSIADHAGAQVIPLEVSVSFRNEAAGIEPITRAMKRGGDMRWRYEGPELTLPGTWTIRIDALIGEFEKASLTGELSIR